MESVSEESVLKETEIVASPPANFGELLRSRREEAGLSVADLARKTGLVRTTIHNIEQGLTSGESADAQATRQRQVSAADRAGQRAARERSMPGSLSSTTRCRWRGGWLPF
jgi:hypothetical protein